MQSLLLLRNTGNKLPVLPAKVVSGRLRKYAQAVLVMAVDLSFAMGTVNILFKNFFMQTPKGSFRLVLAKLTNDAKDYWFENSDYKKLKNP